MADDESKIVAKAKRDAIAGGVAGAISRLSVTPFDVVKIRLQNQVRQQNKPILTPTLEPRYHYTSLLHALRTIYKVEGFFGLWRGNLPAFGLWVLYSSVQFPVYNAMKDRTRSKLSAAQTSLLCGAVAALVAQTAAYPLDTIRTRYISQGPLTIYPTLSNLLWRVVSEEGPRGFFKGWLPTVVQLVPTMAMTFTFYEQLTLWTGREREKTFAMINGTVSGFLAKLLVYPLDTVKKRMQLNGQIPSVPRYNGLVHCVRSIVEQEGFGALYNGVTASLLKTSLSTGVTFMVFETVRANLG